MAEIFSLVKARLKASLNLSHFDIHDFSRGHEHHSTHSGGAHLQSVIVSDAFEGLDLLARHRLIYDLVDDLMQKEIHALSMKTYTPSEWDSIQENTDGNI